LQNNASQTSILWLCKATHFDTGICNHIKTYFTKNSVKFIGQAIVRKLAVHGSFGLSNSIPFTIICVIYTVTQWVYVYILLCACLCMLYDTKALTISAYLIGCYRHCHTVRYCVSLLWLPLTTTAPVYIEDFSNLFNDMSQLIVNTC